MNDQANIVLWTLVGFSLMVFISLSLKEIYDLTLAENRWPFWISSYFIVSGSLAIILKKSNSDSFWYALIPIVNLAVLFDFAGKPVYWLIFLLIPFVNVIIMIIVLMSFLRRIKRNELGVILFLIPIVNHLYWIYLAATLEEINSERKNFSA